MLIRNLIESHYVKQTQFFKQSEGFQHLVSGVADIKFYDEFIANRSKTHLKSSTLR